jgi:hypothetical protein
VRFRYVVEIEVEDEALEKQAQSCDALDQESYNNGVEACLEDSLHEVLGHYKNDEHTKLSIVALERKP